MQSKLRERLEALRRELARQNEQLAQARELVAGQDHLVPVPTELLAEIDRVCDVKAGLPHSNIHNGAIRA